MRLLTKTAAGKKGAQMKGHARLTSRQQASRQANRQASKAMLHGLSTYHGCVVVVTTNYGLVLQEGRGRIRGGLKKEWRKAINHAGDKVAEEEGVCRDISFLSSYRQD